MTRCDAKLARLIACDPELDRRFRLMLTPRRRRNQRAADPGRISRAARRLDARQWVAFSGLDPRSLPRASPSRSDRESAEGAVVTCVERSTCRRSLPCDASPIFGLFYQRLVSRGKARLQAVVAVMRKLLHALFAMFRSNQPTTTPSSAVDRRTSPVRLSGQKERGFSAPLQRENT